MRRKFEDDQRRQMAFWVTGASLTSRTPGWCSHDVAAAWICCCHDKDRIRSQCIMQTRLSLHAYSQTAMKNDDDSKELTEQTQSFAAAYALAHDTAAGSLPSGKLHFAAKLAVSDRS